MQTNIPVTALPLGSSAMTIEARAGTLTIEAGAWNAREDETSASMYMLLDAGSGWERVPAQAAGQ